MSPVDLKALLMEEEQLRELVSQAITRPTIPTQARLTPVDSGTLADGAVSVSAEIDLERTSISTEDCSVAVA